MVENARQSVRKSEKEGITPSFSRGNSDKTSSAAANAADTLRSSEESATGGLYQGGNTLSSTREAEDNPTGGFYTAGKGSKLKGKANGKKSKKGPFISIILAIFGFGGVMMGSQLFQPFSLVAQFQEKFNSMSVSTTVRSGKFINWQMKGVDGGVKDPIKLTFFGKNKFTISPKQKQKLSAQGIDTIDDGRVVSYGDTTILVEDINSDPYFKAHGITYDADTGNFEYEGVRLNGTKVTRTSNDWTEFVNAVNETDTFDGVYGLNKKMEVGTVLRYEDDLGNPRVATANNFDQKYREDPALHRDYNAGSKTWRGQFANWFGSNVINFITNNRLTRNMFSDFRQKVDDSNMSSWDVFKETIKAKIDGTDGTLGVTVAEQNDNMDDTYTTTDKDGNKHTHRRPAKDPTNGNIYADRNNPVAKTDPSIMKAKEISAKIDDIASKFSKGMNVVCTIAQITGTISVLVAAAEAIQIINLTTSAFEIVDKVKAGYEDEAPIHELTNALNSKTTNFTYSLDGEARVSNTEGLEGIKFTTGTTGEKSAMESAGITALYGNGKVDANDKSVSSFNLSKSINGIIGGIAGAGASFASCAAAKLGVATVELAAKSLNTVACIAGVVGAAFTFGATFTACAPKLAELGIRAAISAGVAVMISSVIAVFVPFATAIATRDLVSNLGGEDFGNAITSGANMYQGASHRSAGGSLSDSQTFVAYAAEQQAVIADQAKYERETLSPFDMTSKYTFMGTLMTQLMSFSTSSNTLMGGIKASSSALSNSLIAMSPTTSAYNISEILPGADYDETCPYLASINAVGDAFCNPYIISDMSTMNDEPQEIINRVNDYGGFEDHLDENDNVIVKKGSDLAKYIVYCGDRQSSFGVADYNIANSLSSGAEINTSNSTVNTVLNAAIGSTVIGDITDIIQNTEQLDGMGYVTGESCVAGNDANSVFGGSPSWSKSRDYQRFIEDQALAESMGLIDKSAVAVFLEDYYKENPLDNSYEGMLARYSGLPKEDVELALDLIWYADYIANYDPTERSAFTAPVVEAKEDPMNFDNEYVLASGMTATKEVIYRDIRNRSFAV